MSPALLPLLVLAGAALAGPSLDELDANLRRADPRPGVLALTLAPGQEVAPLAAAHGCVVDHRWGRQPTWTLRCGGPLRDTLAALEEAPGVRRVAAAFPAALVDTTPDDLRGGWWHLPLIGAPAAWDTSTGDPGVVVAVVDTGVRADHVDLVDNLWVNPGEVGCADGVDDDGNGYVDDCGGWDLADQDPDVSPLALPATEGCARAHGTFIAGLAGETGNNGVGGVGVNWDVSLMPLKMVGDADCGLTDLTIAEGIHYATDNGASVLNASWQFSTFSSHVETALQAAAAAGVVTVIAAGNDSADVDATPSYPIWFAVPNTLVVAATNSADQLASFSNHGATRVDLGAPGANVRSTGVDSTIDYENGWGTSYAAPVVAGAVALLRAAYPALTAAELVDSIRDGVEPVGGLDCATHTACVETGGRLSLPGALDRAAAWDDRVSLEATALMVDDAPGEEGGDGDGVLELTEQADLYLELENLGHGTATGVVATLALSGDTGDLDLRDGQVAVGTLAGDRTLLVEDDAFTLAVDAACAADPAVTATLTLTADTGETWTTVLPLDIRCVVDDDGDGSLFPADCDDTVATTFPGADETCNDVDDDCDGEIDEDAVDVVTAWADADGDGYGDPDAAETACVPPSGSVETAGDCDDTDATVSPAGVETCDGVDQDCDGAVDEDLDCAADGGGEGGAGKGTCSTTPRGGGGTLGLGVLAVLGARRRRRQSTTS